MDERNRDGVAIQANPGTGANVEKVSGWERAFPMEGFERTISYSKIGRSEAL